MKLHLGCGQNYLNGYINIDYPLSKHTVQKTAVADRFADLTSLRYPANSIEEIRLHHVFEHFPRTTALALLVSWRSWLKVGGSLVIEVPDFKKSILVYLNPLSSDRNRRLTLRHLFGSQEEKWANHYEGWSKDNLIPILKELGFVYISCRTIHHKGMYNLELVAKKSRVKINSLELNGVIHRYFSQMLVDDSISERDLLSIWKRNFKKQLAKSISI